MQQRNNRVIYMCVQCKKHAMQCGRSGGVRHREKAKRDFKILLRAKNLAGQRAHGTCHDD